jgi:hypothetical protein
VTIGSITIRCDGVSYVVEPTEEVRFGRSPADNEVLIGSARRESVEDTLISRRAGVIVNEYAHLIVRNRGSVAPLDIDISTGPRRRVEPGDELRIAAQPMQVSVEGRVRRYVLDIDAEQSWVPQDLVSWAVAPTEGPLRLSLERRLDLAAVCAPMLGPQRSSKAASYADAAALRGVTRKAMEKRIEHLVADLRERNALPGLEPAAEVKQALCDYAVRTSSVTAADLAGLA